MARRETSEGGMVRRGGADLCPTDVPRRWPPTSCASVASFFRSSVVFFAGAGDARTLRERGPRGARRQPVDVPP